MATVHACMPKAHTADDAGLSDLICESDVEREVLALLRRLDAEDQVGALLILQAVERRAQAAGFCLRG
jgi:hypothetical protein